MSVSLDENRLAVGAYADDGFENSKSNSGAVYLIFIYRQFIFGRKS
ncbi:MAG TPA: hypothetical protein DDW90_10785 [Cyanobacteria bacterium UBA9971]|nr:hypothetical protein [Cyanobacteria bacterium UBA9971]